jgi:hypothetical protein
MTGTIITSRITRELKMMEAAIRQEFAACIATGDA